MYYLDNCSLVMDKILVIGLGQLGYPVAKYAKQKGFDVYGYDISIKAMERAEQLAGIKKSISFKDFDVYIICVSTHKPEDIFSPHIEGLLSIAKKISYEARDGALLSIESTIPKGTSRQVFELLNHRLHVVHAPHRWYSLDEERYGVNQIRVIGGVSPCCLKIGTQFYDGRINLGESVEIKDDNVKSLDIPMHTVSNIEIAELTKIVENSHRFLQIAFAEDLYLYCQANGFSFSELRDALNTKWNVEILEPRDGIGGHCLPKDTKMFLQSSKTIKSKILQAAVEVDNEYRQKRIQKMVKNANLSIL
ncbi:MAG: potassium transporter TrkA [Nitrososphaeraceae archaeon]|nr:potassium transporter TrkA [Nitrososphaeraceae archaeon]